MITTIPDRERALQAQVDALTEELASVEASNRIRGDELERLRAQEPAAWMDRDGDIYPLPEIKNWAPPHKMLFAAPPAQPAEPAQRLTDERIDAVITAGVKSGQISWLGYKEDANGEYTLPSLSPVHYQIARAIESAIVPQWLPIETAPKDWGVTEFDVWACGRRVADCWWGTPTYGAKIGGIVNTTGYDSDGPVDDYVSGATHWMPTTAAPRETT